MAYKRVFLKKGSEEKIFDTMLEAGEFLGVRPKNLIDYHHNSRKKNGWSIRLERIVKGTCVSCGKTIPLQDEECMTCYYEDLTGKEYIAGECMEAKGGEIYYPKGG